MRFSTSLVLALVLTSPLRGAELPAGLATALAARPIGPPGLSGRVTALAGVDSDPTTYYVGAAAGGVWKTTNGGTTFTPVFDDQDVASIGALAVFQPDPRIVWSGTGECDVRNTASSGDGVYRSTDGGATWTHVGLPASERIARIVLHPTDPEIAWVAALGPLWSDGGERGVYRTEDGGKSWRRTLSFDERTGAADLALDPGNPDRLLATLWQVRRRPWDLRSGGPGSGLYASADGGKAWVRRGVADGLPEGELGRIGIAYAPSRPATVYALIELNRAGALARSDDGGATWRTVARGANRSPRPFYFSELRVDPQNPERIYQLHFNLDRSDDGGVTMKPLLLKSGVHADLHAIWIDPRDPRRFLLGTDGGVYESRDGGLSAEWKPGLPLAQFYTIAADADGMLYGGTQDNGAWSGPLNAWAVGGGAREDWRMVGGADAMDSLPDPRADGGYTMQSAGGLVRWNRTGGEWRDVSPPAPSGVALRFGWYAPTAIDRAGALLVGSQFVHRSTDRGETWSVISPDLTTDNPEWQRQKESGGLTPDVAGAENYTTLSTIAVSPVSDREIWAGSDDGRVHVTTDGGGRWREVGAAIPDLPQHTWIQRIVALGHGGALVIADDHRRGNFATYLYETRDGGARWERLVPASGAMGPALSLAVPCADRRILVLGTDRGLWLSLDHGAEWLPWRAGVPPAPVAALALRKGDLVIATHGRGLYAIDDFAAICAVSSSADPAALRLLSLSSEPQRILRTVGGGRGSTDPRSPDRPYGALITLGSAAATPKDHPAIVTLRDGAGRPVRSFEQELTSGVNRFAWGFEHDALWRAPRATGRGELPELDAGPEVTPGRFLLTVRAGETEAKGEVVVTGEGDVEATGRWQALLELGRLQQEVSDALEVIFRLRADLKEKKDLAPPEEARIAAVLSDLDGFDHRLRREPGGPIGVARDNLRSRLYDLEDTVNSSFSSPAEGTLSALRNVARDVEALRRDLDAAKRETEDFPPRGVASSAVENPR